MTRNTIVSFIAGLLVVVPLAASAQTDTATLIQQLRQQIVALQQQLDALQQQQSMETQSQSAASGEVSGDGSIVQAPSTFNRNLYFGLRNDSDVSRLQQFLANQGFYAGPITGNFFSLTLIAVKKFQSIHIITATGYFGPLTRAVANKILAGDTILPSDKSKGSLSIDPVPATIKVGESVRVKAMFTDPVPPCVYSGPVRCLPPIRAPYEVNASFVSSNPLVADITMIAECAPPPPGIPPACSVNTFYLVRGVSSGTAVITATYTNEQGTFTAKINVVVVGATIGSAQGYLNIEPSSATIKVGESVRVKAIYQPPQPACDFAATGGCLGANPAPYEVNASFVSSNPLIADIIMIFPECPQPRQGIPPACSSNISNLIQGVSIGAATITATYTNDQGTFTAKIQVTVILPPTIIFAPTITTQPASQTVNAGQTATFSVVAAGTAPLSYQWQKNNVNIAGATGASYTTPAATATDNASTYRVIVSNSAGSITSNTATLAVKTVLVEEPVPTLVDMSSSCAAGLKARFIKTDGTYIGVTEPNPCATLDSTAPVPEFARAIYSRGRETGMIQPFDYSAGSGYTLIRQQGDCDDMLFDLRDDFLGHTYSYYIGGVCSTIDMSVAKNTAENVVAYVRSQGVELVPNSGEGVFSRCDYRVTPANYIATIARIPKKASAWRAVCFAAGNYGTAIALKGYENVAFIGAGKDATIIELNLPVRSDAGTNSDDPSSIFQIYSSKNILIQGMTLSNLKPYVNVGVVSNDQVSRALTVGYTPGLTVRDVVAKSLGKVPVEIQGPLSRIFNSALSGSYFTFTGDNGAYLVDSSDLSQNLQGDQHSLTWTSGAHIYYRNVRTSTHTGRSLISGNGIDAVKNIRVENLTALTPLDSWMQQHPNYGNMRVQLYGTYPPSTVDYWYNPVGGGGPSQNVAVIKHTETLEFLVPY